MLKTIVKTDKYKKPIMLSLSSILDVAKSKVKNPRIKREL